MIRYKRLVFNFDMIDSYHIYFKGDILFKDLNRDDFEFVWNKLYTSYINAMDDDLTYEQISEKKSQGELHQFEPSY